VKNEVAQACRSGVHVEYKKNRPCDSWGGLYDGCLIVDGVPHYYVTRKEVQSVSSWSP
jgi:hypothetical protein